MVSSGGVDMPQNGGGKGWVVGASGEKEMPELWGELLDWLLLGPDRSPRTQKEWVEGRDIHVDSLRRIKRDPRFVREWDRRAAELNIHPERTQSVIDSLFKQAADGDVKAASLYLQYIDKFTPKRRVVVDDERAASGLSDLELADELEALVAEFRVDDVAEES